MLKNFNWKLIQVEVYSIFYFLQISNMLFHAYFAFKKLVKKKWTQGSLKYFYQLLTVSAKFIIGCIIAIAIQPTATAKNTIIIGSNNLFNIAIILLTCSS